MAKPANFFKLIAWFWNHSDIFLKVVKAAQDKLPQVVGGLRFSAGSLDRLTSLETTVATTIDDAMTPLRNIPVPEFDSIGLYDAMVDALGKLGVKITITPSDTIIGEMNEKKIPTISILSLADSNSALAES